MAYILDGYVRYSFSLTTTVLDTQMSDNCVTVQLYTYVTFQYEEGGEPAVCGDWYAVRFAKINGHWCIVDVISEEMLAYGLTKDKFNLESAIAAFDKSQATQQAAADSIDMVQVTPEVKGEQKMVAPGGAYIPYTMVYDRKNRYASSSTGTSCYCVNCGACKLKATGKMIKPIRVGTTALCKVLQM